MTGRTELAPAVVGAPWGVLGVVPGLFLRCGSELTLLTFRRSELVRGWANPRVRNLTRLRGANSSRTLLRRLS